MQGQQEDRPHFHRVPIVGIGASAGGIEALQKFFAALPDKVGAAFVVVVHLDPEHTSELAGILSMRTRMRVLQVTNRMPIEADTVYVIPPNRQLLVTGYDIASTPFKEPRGQRTPIDLFFRSLAEQHGDGFAVVLSGSGSDGAVGVKAVRERGGLILVQDPNEAQFPMMPRSAIASGADVILPVDELARRLGKLIQAKASVDPQLMTDGDDEALRRILAYLSSKTGQDFSKYKRATVARRVGRRMQVAHLQQLEEYDAYLRSHVEEVQALFQDLLISVTRFFRDPRAYEALVAEVLPRLFAKELPNNQVRIWIPGCATGEEAYSLAMLVLEEAGRREIRPKMQVFATDLDARALAIAREGVYPTAISADVNDERLRRFFNKEGTHYRVRREVRDLVMFASHNLLKDPPFSRLDLISCRNLLIYLDRDLQQQVCNTFHYALLPDGFLLLGNSETPDQSQGLFTVVDREARIYRVNGSIRNVLPPLPRALSTVTLPNIPINTPTLPIASNDSVTHRQMLEEFSPPSMVVDDSHHITNLSESAGRFLLLPSGPILTDAAEIVRPELRLELLAALRRAFESNESTVTLPIPVQFDGSPQSIVMNVRPRHVDSGPRRALVLFIEGGPAEAADTSVASAGEPSAALVVQLREELLATRRLLRTTREQYEVAAESHRATNEELQSINEEYRSTAEELETSKEELQSINEELQTLNNELKLKFELVSQAHNDLQNLMAASDFGTLFLDRELRIKRFTPRTKDLFNILSGDEGRPITDFTHHLEYPGLLDDARKVLADLVPLERNIRSADGRWFMTRVRPYRTIDDKIEGIVLTFIDVTDRRRADEAWSARQRTLLDELSHRVKNTLAVVQVIVRNSLAGSGVKPEAMASLGNRLRALATAHDALLRNEWKGVHVDALIREQLETYAVEKKDHLHVSGPAVLLPPALVMPFTLLLHELGTNAIKHGAWSHPEGVVDLSWKIHKASEGNELEINWRERGGPTVRKPSVVSFGTTLIDRCMPEAVVQKQWAGEGLVVTIKVPLRALQTRTPVTLG